MKRQRLVVAASLHISPAQFSSNPGDPRHSDRATTLVRYAGPAMVEEKEPEPAAEQLEDDEYASTPLDHPMFLPVLFLGLALWFGYDAYLNDDPDMLEHLDFNRYGFRVLVFLGMLYGYQGVCEIKQIPSHPLVMPALLIFSTAWLAHDAWLSGDAHNLLRAAVNRALVPWLGALTAWYSLTGWLHAQGKREPAYVLPLLILACACWFGYNGFLNDSEAAAADATVNRWVASGIALAFLVSVYVAIRRPRGPTGTPGDEVAPLG